MGGRENPTHIKKTLSGKVDPNQEQEEVSHSQEADSKDSGALSPISELNETLNITRAFSTIRREASKSGLDIQENLDSVLQKDLKRRLKSLVLIPSQDRESVITRTPSRSVVTSTPIDSANNSPEPPLKCLNPNLIPHQDSRYPSCSPNCSEISSLDSEVFQDSEPFNPLLENSNKPPSIAPPNRYDHKLTATQGTITMEESEEEIHLRNQTLAYQIQAYNPEDIDETDVNDKIYLAKLEELDRLQKDVIGKVDKFLYKFPHTDKRQYYEDLSRKALSNVSKHKQLLRAKVSQVKSNMASNVTASLVHSHSEVDYDLKRREVEAMEAANKIAEKQAVEAKKLERQKSVLKAKSIFDDIRIDIAKLDEKITEIDVDEWPEEDDYSVSKGMRRLDKWEEKNSCFILVSGKLIGFHCE